MAESFTGSKISRCGVQKLVADKAIAKKSAEDAERYLKDAQLLTPDNISLDVTRRAFNDMLDEHQWQQYSRE